MRSGSAGSARREASDTWVGSRAAERAKPERAESSSSSARSAAPESSIQASSAEPWPSASAKAVAVAV
eukprot:466537-Alexandrium_andersonii.AAC.1